MPLDTNFSSLYLEFKTILLPGAIDVAVFFAPMALAAILSLIAVELWVKYIRAKYFLSLKYVLLEIKLPKDTFKSPLAMEAILNSFHNGSDGNLFGQFWKGEHRPWFSLELVSIEGQVKFHIWMQQQRRAFLESALYAQFPGIEVKESPDYAKTVHFDPKVYSAWATEFAFTKADPYPIKTYIDYGLDKDPKEEFKVDPLSSILEYLGQIGPNQQIWIQIMGQAHKKVRKSGSIFKKEDKWEEAAKKEINDLLKRDPKTKVVGEANDKGFLMSPKITKEEEDVVAALGRSLTKPPFDVGIRAIYIAKKDMFNKSNIGGIIGSFKHFSSQHLNGFKPGGPWAVDYPWQDYRDIRKNRKLKAVIGFYKRRAYFHPPYEGKAMVMNAEELATLFHFPGQVAATPTLERVPSKKAQAPTNLPI